MSSISRTHSATNSEHKAVIEKFISRILMALIVFSLAAAGLNAFLGYRVESERLVENHRDDVEGTRITELQVLEKQIELDVVQVQQFLTDVSATRAQNGLNDGWEEAEKHAQAFRTEIDRAKKLAADLNAPELAGSLDATASRFPAYYETGVRMSHAYVDQGPAGGNALMPQFDQSAEALTGALQRTQGAEHQAATLEQTAAAHNEITETVNRTRSVAAEASRMVGEARVGAERSREVVGETIAAINEIEQSSSQITRIIGVIDEIAFQTNLRALNAGVEAARAGDAGRGFAVVATEVRALAQRSAGAAKEIKGLIETSARAVGRGVELAGVTGESLNGIVDQVIAVAQRVEDIAEAAAEQSRGLEEVNIAISNLDTVTQQNAAVADDSNRTAETLKDEADNLVRQVSRFRISGDQGPASRGSRHAA